MPRFAYVVAGCLGAVCLLAGCGGEGRDPAVITLADVVVPLSQIEAEYDRIHQDDWADLAFEGRKDFVELVSKRELVLHHVKESAGGELGQREQLILDRWVEKQAMMRYWPKRRAAISIPEGFIDSLAAEMTDERFISFIMCTHKEDAEAIHREILAGGLFSEVGTRYNESNPSGVIMSDAGWLTRPALAPEHAAAIFGIEQVGGICAPIESPRQGWLVLRLDSLRTVAPEQQRRAAEGLADRFYRGKKMAELSEELHAQYNFELVGDGLKPIQRHFQAMFDSVAADRDAGKQVDYQALEPPLHRFTAEELALPLFNWTEGIYTVGDFVRSLYLVDLDYWPTVGDSAKIATQIKRRMVRWAMMEEVRQVGWIEEGGFAEEVKRKRNHLFLEMFEVQHLAHHAEPVAEDRLRSYWQQNRQDYRSKDLVGYGFLRFPSDMHQEAQRAAEELHRGMQWEMVAGNACDADERIEFQAAMDPIEAGPHRTLTNHALRYDLGPEGAATYSELLEIDGEWVILRIHYREHPHVLDFADAREKVEHDLQVQALEAALASKVEEFSQQYGLAIDYEALR
jgi:hypothetical protein